MMHRRRSRIESPEIVSGRIHRVDRRTEGQRAQQQAGMRVVIFAVTKRDAAVCRFWPDSSTFRSRTCSGVTSTHSSLLMNSSACSNDSGRGGISRTSSSAVDERMFVSFFSFVGFTSRSSARAFSPTITPS